MSRRCHDKATCVQDANCPQTQNVVNMVNECFVLDEIFRPTAPELWVEETLSQEESRDNKNLSQGVPKDIQQESQLHSHKDAIRVTNIPESNFPESVAANATETGIKWKQHMAALLAALSAMSVGYVDGWTANALPFLEAPARLGNVTWRMSPPDARTGMFTTTAYPPGDFFSSTKDLSNSLSPELATFQTVLSATYDSANVTAVTAGNEVVGGVVHGLTPEQASWISSLVPIGAMLGSIPAGFIADLLGRKIVLLAMTIPCLISWLIIIFCSNSIEMLYLSRGIAGIIMGIVLVVVPLYNEEIAEVSIRGAIGVYQNMMVTAGILFCYIVGAFVPYIWTAVIPCVIPFIMFVTFVWMPESPTFLFKTHRQAEGLKVIRWLRGTASNTSADMIQAMAAGSARLEEKTSLLCTMKRIFTALSTQPSARPLYCVFLLMIFRQLTGIHAVIFYTVEIFEDAQSPIPATYAAIIIGLVEVGSTYAASLLVDRMGRRILLLTSGIGTASCHLFLAFFYGFLELGYNSDNFSWFPIIFIPLFIILYACGFGPLPWFMMAELTPNEHKNWASGITGFLNWGSMFLVIKLFPTLTTQMGEYVTFGIFAFNCTVASIFVFFWIPETKGKTLEQIQRDIAEKRV